MFALCVESGRLDESRVLRVVELACHSTARHRFALLKQFDRLLRNHLKQSCAKVESAVPLSDAMQTEIATRLSKMMRSEREVTFVTNPDLIGGMRIQVGDDVYDGSVYGRLCELEHRFSGPTSE